MFDSLLKVDNKLLENEEFTSKHALIQFWNSTRLTKVYFKH